MFAIGARDTWLKSGTTLNGYAGTSRIQVARPEVCLVSQHVMILDHDGFAKCTDEAVSSQGLEAAIEMDRTKAQRIGKIGLRYRQNELFPVTVADGLKPACQFQE